MLDYLKHYRVKISALSPIYVGSGVKTGKKEYIYIPRNHKVIIPDMEKMYMDIQKRNLESAFESYMIDARSRVPSLSEWLFKQEFVAEDYERWKKYEMDAGEAFVSETNRPKEIDAFVKDAYGMPYVPGSSIKGMFRSALIAWEMHCHPEKYERVKREIARNSQEKASRKNCLARETRQMEVLALNQLDRDEKTDSSAVNDVMAGFYVSDSEAINTDALTLSQKIDYTLDGKERALPLLRETLKPGTDIYFDVCIDTTLCPYRMEDVMKALNYFQEISYQYFYSRFRRGKQQENIVWLGGGCGFLSKTVLYPLFEKDAVKVVDGIYKNTLGKNYTVHKHTRDVALKLAPHVCKCTRYQGKLYDMGMGRMEIIS